MPDDDIPDAAATADVDGTDLLILFGLVLITVALTALFGWEIAALAAGILLIAGGVTRALAGGRQ